MNDKIKSEKFRKLSITALVAGILGYSILLSGIIIDRIPDNPSTRLILIITGVILAICLPAAAIVCGSIDLKRIKEGHYSNKGKGSDITRIVLGSVLILVALIDFIASMPGAQF